MDSSEWKKVYDQYTSPKEFLSNPWGKALPISEQYWVDLSPEKNEAIILLHGINSDHSTYLPAAERLAEKYRVILPDLRAHGKSAYNSNLPTYATLAQDLAALIEHLGLQKIHVGGHSHGGRLAMKLSALNPQKIKSVMVEDMMLESINPNLTFDNFIYNEMIAEKFKAIKAHYANREEFTKHLNVLLTQKDAQHYGAILGEETADGSISFGYVWAHKRMDFLFKWEDLTEEMRLFQGRFLLLWADPKRSRFCKKESVDWMKCNLRHFDMHFFPDHSHNLHKKIPTQFAEKILNFLG